MGSDVSVYTVCRETRIRCMLRMLDCREHGLWRGRGLRLFQRRPADGVSESCDGQLFKEQARVNVKDLAVSGVLDANHSRMATLK